MTDADGQRAKPVDPQASLRSALVGELATAQLALEAAIAALSRSGGDSSGLAASRSQLTSIIGLRQQINAASGTTLASLSAEIVAAAASATALAQQAQGSMSAASGTSADIAQLAAASRAQVNAVMRGMKDFDASLQFASAEEEAAYRKREAERQAYVAAQQAKATPQGDLNAANAAIAQMNDAKAHGAGDNPEFADRLAALSQSRDNLRDAIAKPPAERATAPTTDIPATNKGSAVKADNELDAVMAALREAGVTPAVTTDEPTAMTQRAQQPEARSRAPTSGRG